MANIYKQADQRRRVAPGSKRGEAPAVKEETKIAPETVEEVKVEVKEEPVVENREEVAWVKTEPAVETTVEPEVSKPAPAPKKPKKEAAPKKEAEKATVEFDFPVRVKGKKKNYSLYLSETNMEELQKRSKQFGMSVSEYLDEILKKVFEG